MTDWLASVRSASFNSVWNSVALELPQRGCQHAMADAVEGAQQLRTRRQLEAIRLALAVPVGATLLALLLSGFVLKRRVALAG